eukprot:scaffold2318_cov396-Prasinococcus_capsulatus_cf.AAC.2
MPPVLLTALHTMYNLCLLEQAPRELFLDANRVYRVRARSIREPSQPAAASGAKAASHLRECQRLAEGLFGERHVRIRAAHGDATCDHLRFCLQHHPRVGDLIQG